MADSSQAARTRAEESIATRFTRIMNATTSPYGVLCDPAFVAVATAPLFLAFLGALELDASKGVVWAFGALFALPFAVALVVSAALLGSKRRVVDWLAGVPFPIENMNAVLNGLGDAIEVTFVADCPKSTELNQELDKVATEVFVMRAPDIEPDAPQASDGKVTPASTPENVVEIRIGVVDSKRNPAGSNHRRYERVRAIVGAVLVPLHARFKIVEARIK